MSTGDASSTSATDATDDADAPPLDAGSDAPPPPAYDGGFSPPSDCDLGGTAARAAWPQEGYCATHRNRGPYAAATSSVSLHGPYPVPGVLDAQPAIGADGSLYVSSEGNTIESLNADGSFRWRYTDVEPKTQFYAMPVLAADGTVRAYDDENVLYVVLDAGTGALLLRHVDSALVAGGLAVVTSATYLVDGETDQLESRSPEGGVLWSWAGGNTDQVPAVAHDGTVLFTESGALTAIYGDGGQRWSITAAGPTDVFDGVAVGTDDSVRGYTSASGVLSSYDLATHALNWSASFDGGGGINGFAIGDDGTTFVGTSANGLVRVDGAGHEGATFGQRCGAPTIDAAGHVLALCNSSIVCLSADLATQYWSFPAPTPEPSFDSYIVGRLVVGPSGAVYVALHNGLEDGGAQDSIYAIGP